MMRPAWALAAGVIALGACQENLASPGDCPTLCPGEQIIVRDTAIDALPSSDSSFFGYQSRAGRTALLIANGLAAGEFRAFVVFPTIRSDSITVDAVARAFTVDTAQIAFTLQSRDSTATNLRVYLRRIPIKSDTTLTYDSLTALIAAAPVFDSIMVPDTLKAGLIKVLFTGDRLALIQTPPEDSGRIGLALTVQSVKPTGIRLEVDASASTGAPLFQLRGRAEIADTTKRRQTVSVRPGAVDKYGYYGNLDLAATADPALLYIGGPRSGRSIVRFSIPAFIRDSAQVLRATLELTPARLLTGLPGAAIQDSVAVRGVQADLGAKSPPLGVIGLQLAGLLAEGSQSLVRVDLIRLVAQWQAKGGPPQTVFLADSDEPTGGSFMQPVFYSTRSASGQPRLRITYGLPTRPGRP